MYNRIEKTLYHLHKYELVDVREKSQQLAGAKNISLIIIRDLILDFRY